MMNLMAKDYPLGVSPGCYSYHYGFYDTSGGEFGNFRSVHSSHFQIMADLGFVGLFVWTVLFLISFMKLWSIRKRALSKTVQDPGFNFYVNLANVLICAQLVFILGGTFYEFAYNDFTWLIWGILIGVERLFEKEVKDCQA